MKTRRLLLIGACFLRVNTIESTIRLKSKYIIQITQCEHTIYLDRITYDCHNIISLINSSSWDSEEPDTWGLFPCVLF